MAEYNRDRKTAASADVTTTAQVLEAWNAFHKADGEEMQRIVFGRKVMNREIDAPVPDHIELGRQSFKVNLHHAITNPIHTLNLVTQKWPVYRRYATGVDIRPQEVSSKIEQSANTGMKKLFAYREAGDLILNEGQVYVTVAPDRAHYETSPDYFDADSMLNERQYSRLGPQEKKLYVEDVGSKQARRFGIPDKRYQRDAKGRGPDHPYYTGSDREFTRDRSESSKAYLKELERHRGARLPLTIRTWSRQDVAPIGRRFTGTGIEIDSMVTRETFTKSHLMRKGYVWEGQSDALVSDLNGDVTLYGWWYIDPEGCPTVAWSVDGCPTWKKKKTADGDDMAEATVNLRETCGLTRLPIATAPGWHTADRDIEKRYKPFPWVFGHGWLAADAVASGIAYREWATGYGGKLFMPDSQDDFEAMLERNTPGMPRNIIQTKPGSITIMPPGKFVDPNQGGNQTGYQMLDFLLQQNEEGATPSAAAGGGGDVSGWARNVQSAQVQQSLSHVRDGLLTLYGQVGSLFLEVMTRHAERYGPVKIAAPTPVPIASSEKSPTRTVIEFTESLCGEMFDIEAEFEVTFGENLAQNAQAIEMAKNRVIPWRKALELIGDPSPEETEAEILAEDERRSEQGLARVRSLAARIVGDEEEAARLQAVANGEVDENGEPTGATAGLEGPGGGIAPPQDGGGATGFSSPDPGKQQLAGLVGGAHQTGPTNQAGALAASTGTVMPTPSVNGTGL